MVYPDIASLSRPLLSTSSRHVDAVPSLFVKVVWIGSLPNKCFLPIPSSAGSSRALTPAFTEPLISRVSFFIMTAISCAPARSFPPPISEFSLQTQLGSVPSFFPFPGLLDFLQFPVDGVLNTLYLFS